MKKARTIAEFFINAFIEQNFRHGALTVKYESPYSALITDADGMTAHLVYRDGTVCWEEES